jgi:predicted Zn-dependent protease
LLLNKLKKQGREYKGYHGLFASHPDNDTRLHEVVAKAERYKMGEKKRGSHTYLAQINGMTFGDSEKQGIRSGRNFYHLDLGFAVAFPAKWQINNNPTSLQAIAPDGNAFIQMTTTDINRKTTPQKFVQQRLKIEDLRSGKAFKAHGLSSYTGVVEEDGKVGRISVVFLGQRAYIFFATSKEPQQFQQFDKDFLATAESFHKLRKNEKQLAMGKRIDIVKVSAKDSYAKWAKKSRISNSPEQQLRLLNAHYPQGELVEGQQAKRVK